MQSIIKRRNVELVGCGHRARPGGSTTRSTSPAKTARFVRADGRVRAIELTCSCGEVTVLEVEYEVLQEDASEETP